MTHTAGYTIDVIVPTFREAENLPELVSRLNALRAEHFPRLHMTIVDDNSRDGTEEFVRSLDTDWVRLLVRTNERGLSGAVLHGIENTTNAIIVVMDADLSHPPESLPKMIAELASGADFVVGSRYIEGGGTTDDWGVLRWLNSRIATLLARPFTKISDPMSGYFALRRDTYLRAENLNPIGYKIGLELIVKCSCRRVAEIPIRFVNRTRGQSKLSFKEQLRYIQHLRRLSLFKFGIMSEVAQFAVVGLSGTAVNLGILTALLHFGVRAYVSVACAIGASLVSNFALNRRFTFSYSRTGHLPTQFAGYLVSNGLGALVNYSVTIGLLHALPKLAPQLASLFGIAIATSINFFSLKFLIFKKRHVFKEHL